jgi:GH24 family phage-related lysozyme (muramidase)
MAAFRRAVADYLAGKTPPPLIPAQDKENRPTMRRGARGEAVRELQMLLHIDPDGLFGPRTEAALRLRQRELGLVGDGIAGPKTWGVLLGESPPHIQNAAPPRRPRNARGWTIGAEGIALIKSFESCEAPTADGRFAAYKDPGSRDGKPYTIGWGSTGPDIDLSTVWSQDECNARFETDIQRYADEVAAAIGDAPTTQNQFDALVSFHYNTGAIGSATLTRRHKAGDFEGAKAAFGWWIKNDGKVMRGLVRRRQAEVELYCKL